MRLKKLTKEVLLLSSLLAIALATFATVVYSTYQEHEQAIKPVDVLRDWKINVDSSRVYSPGDVVTINSTFKKLIDVTGQTNRYVQCYKPGTTTWDGLIPANTTKASQGKTNNGRGSFIIGIPLTTGPLPNTCRVYIIATYNVNKYHPAFQEQNYSNTFQVLPQSNRGDGSGRTTTDNPTSGTTVDGTYNSAFPIQGYQGSQPPLVIVQDNSDSNQENAPPTNRRSNPVSNLLNSATNGIKSIVNIVPGVNL